MQFDPPKSQEGRFPTSNDQGVDDTPAPNRFSNFSPEWEELLLQTKFLAAGSSLGHLSTDRTNRLGSKIRQREGAGGGGGNHPPRTFLPTFSSNEDDIQS